MKRFLLLLLIAILTVGPLTACQKRVVRRRGIGDPLYKDRPPESPNNVVGRKYDDGEFEKQN